MAQIALYPFQGNKSKNTLPLDILINAAWQFAHAALWQEQNFYPKEVERVKREITQYFQSDENQQVAFIAFCQRIILANRYLACEKTRFLPNPSIWFNKHFQQGFTGTLASFNDLQTKREQIPDYYEGISTLATYYWQYTNEPLSKAFITCRKKLVRLKEYGLIQLFYNAIIYSQLLNPAC